ncbi:hypothetical protein GJAV_G00143810 [Gymnothorax javanicus]|nr:hypothetical protein GJAV_G00143810 [Gymnothorax javanicus]
MTEERNDAGTPELRLVLLGSLGCGKTLSGDTILGQHFMATGSGSPRTCQVREGVSEGCRLTLVEAPRWYWSGGQVEASVQQETKRALSLADPGPHAFLILVPVGEYTDVERRVPGELEKIFGDGSLRHSMVLFTHGDHLMGKGPEEYLAGEDPGLREVVEKCGGRYHVFNNRRAQDRTQVRTLLDKLQRMVRDNGGCYVPSSLKRRVERRVSGGNAEDKTHPTERQVQSEASAKVRRMGNGLQSHLYQESSTPQHISTRDTLQYSSPKDTTHYSSTRDTLQYSSTRDTTHYSSTRDAAQYSSTRDTTHYSSTRDAPRHTSARDTLQYNSPRDTTERTSTRDTLQNTSPRGTSQRIAVWDTHQYASIGDSPRHSAPWDSSSTRDTTQRPSGRDSSQYTSTRSIQQYSSSRDTAARPEPDATEETSDSLHSPVKRTSSYRLTSDGALLSQMAQEKPNKNYVNTCHHQISPTTEGPVSPTSSSFLRSSSSPVWSSSFPHPSELRLVLLGRKGAGKSSAGNTILGREEFVSRGDSAAAVTLECEKKKGMVAGRRVAVVDTPDWFRSELPPEDIRRQVSSCVALSAPGPHAFLLCVPVDEPAEMELEALGALEAVFGRDAVRKYTLVLFTHSDRLREGDGVEEYIITQRKDLLQLVEWCGDRYHILERETGRAGKAADGGKRGRKSVEDLLQKVEQTVKENGDSCYSCDLFQEAESRVRLRQEEIMRERRERASERERGGTQGPMRSLASSSSSSLYSVQELEEEEQEQVREEAENSVGELKVEALPSLAASPSLWAQVWEKVAAGASHVPKLTAGGGLVGGVVGVFLGGLLGGVVGATAGSVITEVGRRKYGSQKTKTE